MKLFIGIGIIYLASGLSSLFAQESSSLISLTSIQPKGKCSDNCKSPQSSPFRKANQTLDFFITGSFTYWQPSQENMELGVLGDITEILDLIRGSEVNLDFGFKPGFQVGMGVNLPSDHWDIYSEYTWLRGTDYVSENLDPANPLVSLAPAWEVPTVNNPTYFLAREKWKLSMDLFNAELGRGYFIGKNLSLRPFIGLCSPWIRQQIKVDYLMHVDNPLEDTHIRQSFHSWGIGPRTGGSLNWLLGCGFRLIGKAGADLVYTQYRKLHFRQHISGIGDSIVPRTRIIIHQNTVSCLRTHLDLSLGFDWGSYFLENRWHINFAAEYKFQVYFNQNMFRNFLDDQAIGKSIVSNGDLFIQGLTVTSRLDF